jgi:predicted TPR repeat methyltransferase
MKKGSHSAAIRRYEEALKWQPNWALPWLKIAQAQEKKEDPGRAAEAYRKYLEALPAKQKDKAASELRRRIERLEREAEKQ